jgi:hypothetical protein
VNGHQFLHPLVFRQVAVRFRPLRVTGRLLPPLSLLLVGELLPEAGPATPRPRTATRFLSKERVGESFTLLTSVLRSPPGRGPIRGAKASATDRGPPAGSESSPRRRLRVMSRRLADMTIESRQFEWHQIALRETDFRGESREI